MHETGCPLYAGREARGCARCVLCTIFYRIATDSGAVDKMEQMLGSYGPSPEGRPYTKDFDPEESPSGMLARSGTYNVRSRVVDDDGHFVVGEVP